MYALCLRLTGNRADAEERVQDVFVRAWRKLQLFRGESAFSTWLYRLAVNVVLSSGRGASRAGQRHTSLQDSVSADPPDRMPPEGLGIDLERSIAALPDGAREVFVLYDVEGYSHAEIARACGIATGTSKAQLFRARRLLREMLER